MHRRVPLAWWAIRSLAAIDLPMVVDLSLDYRVLAFAVAISLVTGVAFGLAPALKATRVDLVPTLRGDGEPRLSENRWLTVKNALVVVQVMVSVLLLAAPACSSSCCTRRGPCAPASPSTAWR